MAGAVASVAALPAIALGAAFTTCACPAHQPSTGTTIAAHVVSHDMPGHTAQMASAGAGTAMDMAWIVGSERAPLVTRNLPGPLLRGAAPAAPTDVASGTAAAPAATPMHAAPRPMAMAARAEVPLASRATLTVSEATAKLSPRCRKLVKAKRPSRLSKADRRRRTACLKQRSRLIAASADQPTATTPTATPTPAPAATTPQATTPGSPTATPVPTPTPAPGSPCANKNPCVAAVGVSAIDSGTRLYFTLTRGTVMADRVSFEYTNTDSQSHNLYIEPKGDPASRKAIVADLAMKDRTTAEIALSPGTYTLRCTIPGHETMVVDFVVQAPIR